MKGQSWSSNVTTQNHRNSTTFEQKKIHNYLFVTAPTLARFQVPCTGGTSPMFLSVS
jgi:hypothetical protein